MMSPDAVMRSVGEETMWRLLTCYKGRLRAADLACTGVVVSKLTKPTTVQPCTTVGSEVLQGRGE